jgi:uncharacterized protein YbbK (DUF523 family)
MKLCSACLLGFCCCYDGKHNLHNKIAALALKELLIPVCPEQMGGLPTPRPPAEMLNNQVITKEGINITEAFEKGAHEVLKLALRYNIKEAILKQRSPSCGNGQIYDGTFSKTTIEGYGITSQLLINNGIKIISEENTTTI